MKNIITVEGGEYIGKTSVIVPTIVKVLEDLNIKHIHSREPGGTVHGEKIRDEIFFKKENGASEEELLLLFNKARKIHIDHVIRPFLEENPEGIVIIDRYFDTTRILQGLIGGIDMSKIFELEKFYVRDFIPYHTFIGYFPENKFVETIEKRIECGNKDKKRSENAFDRISIDEHLQSQQAYLQLPNISNQLKENRNFYLIDCSLNPTEVSIQVKDVLGNIF